MSKRKRIDRITLYTVIKMGKYKYHNLKYIGGVDVPYLSWLVEEVYKDDIVDDSVINLLLSTNNRFYGYTMVEVTK